MNDYDAAEANGREDELDAELTVSALRSMLRASSPRRSSGPS
jgi:hypothetical protein